MRRMRLWAGESGDRLMTSLRGLAMVWGGLILLAWGVQAAIRDRRR